MSSQNSFFFLLKNLTYTNYWALSDTSVDSSAAKTMHDVSSSCGNTYWVNSSVFLWLMMLTQVFTWLFIFLHKTLLVLRQERFQLLHSTPPSVNVFICWPTIPVNSRKPSLMLLCSKGFLVINRIRLLDHLFSVPSVRIIYNT